MHLGSIMEHLREEGAAAEALLALGDIVLIAEVDRVRRQHDEDVGEYVTGAVQRFANLGSSEDWLQLMTRMEKSENPAATCLAMMLRWSVDRDENEKHNAQCRCDGNSSERHECV